MKKFLKKVLFGTDVPQEYLCITEKGILSPLKIIFTCGDFQIDVTGSHLFLGYKPVVIGIKFEKEIQIDALKKPGLLFAAGNSQKPLAELELELDSVKKTVGKNLAIYKCIAGNHKFVSSFQKQMNLLHQRLRKKKLGNVNLPGNLYEQVKIAYAVPRKICLITLGGEGMYNMFPTDLHGRIDDENYLISLRADGKANAQVNKFKKIALSKMNLNRYRYVYSLGKNHMQDLKTREAFEMDENSSAVYNLPLPAGAVEYLELEHTGSSEIGIHNLNFFKVTGSKTLNAAEPVLSHVHRAYVSWLQKKGESIEYFLR